MKLIIFCKPYVAILKLCIKEYIPKLILIIIISHEGLFSKNNFSSNILKSKSLRHICFISVYTSATKCAERKTHLLERPIKIPS